MFVGVCIFGIVFVHIAGLTIGLVSARSFDVIFAYVCKLAISFMGLYHNMLHVFIIPRFAKLFSLFVE